MGFWKWLVAIWTPSSCTQERHCSCFFKHVCIEEKTMALILFQNSTTYRMLAYTSWAIIRVILEKATHGEPQQRMAGNVGCEVIRSSVESPAAQNDWHVNPPSIQSPPSLGLYCISIEQVHRVCRHQSREVKTQRLWERALWEDIFIYAHHPWNSRSGTISWVQLCARLCACLLWRAIKDQGAQLAKMPTRGSESEWRW
jgi:hypothetical protein